LCSVEQSLEEEPFAISTPRFSTTAATPLFLQREKLWPKTNKANIKDKQVYQAKEKKKGMK